MDVLTDTERSMLIEELAKRPRFQLEHFTAEAREVSPTCGDEVTVRLRVVASEIQEIGISAHGCTVSMAAAAALAAIAPISFPEFSKVLARYEASVAPGGSPLDGDLEAFAGIGRFPLRARCATLAWRAAAAAVRGG